jgi:hypothetical protein
MTHRLAALITAAIRAASITTGAQSPLFTSRVEVRLDVLVPQAGAAGGPPARGRVTTTALRRRSISSTSATCR